MAATLADFLNTAPVSNGVHQISPARAFQHAEEEYDDNRPADQRTPDFYTHEGANLVAFFRSHGYPEGAPMLEIGCGSGAMTASLATQPAIGHLLATDPSPAFCRITRQKLATLPNAASRID